MNDQHVIKGIFFNHKSKLSRIHLKSELFYYDLRYYQAKLSAKGFIGRESMQNDDKQKCIQRDKERRKWHIISPAQAFEMRLMTLLFSIWNCVHHYFQAE